MKFLISVNVKNVQTSRLVLSLFGFPLCYRILKVLLSMRLKCLVLAGIHDSSKRLDKYFEVL